MGVCCGVIRNSLDRLIRIAFMRETGGEPKLRVLRKFLVELSVKLPLRRNIVPEEQVARMNARTVSTSRVCCSRSQKLSDFGTRNITHHLGGGADCVEGLQELFRIFARTVVSEGPRRNRLCEVRISELRLKIGIERCKYITDLSFADRRIHGDDANLEAQYGRRSTVVSCVKLV